MKKPLTAACLLALAGCLEVQPVPSSAVTVAPPSNPRGAALAYARQTFFDPYTVRDASISRPFVIPYGFSGTEQVWVVCIRANAKNRMGGYTGLQNTLIAFDGNSVDARRSGDDPGNACRSGVFEPFPELERLS